MEGNNFEKKIQHKLDGLKIPPSDKVWNQVAQQIGKKKKDRRIIFILFFLGLLLLSGGYWWWNPSNQYQQDEPLIHVTTKDHKAELPSGLRGTKKDTSSGNLEASIGTPPIPYGNRNAAIQNAPASDVNAPLKTIQREVKGIPNSLERATTLSPELKRKGSIRVQEDKEPNNKEFESYINVPGNKPSHGIETNGIQEKVSGDAKNSTINDRLIDPVETAKNAKQPITINDSIAQKPAKIPHPNHWVFGITLSGGKSLLVNDFLGVGDPYPIPSSDYNSAPGGGQGGSNVGYAFPSSIHNSVAFIGGIILEKNISPRDKLSLGMSYKYFSLMNKVGKRSSNGFNQYSATNTVYSYRNTFHYLEIPVSMKFQINNKVTFPLYWEAGISLSRLIGSNALQFQSSPGLYFNDNSLFNKTQLGLHTGISATLFSKQQTPVTVGPYFYYSTSKVAGKGFYQGKHFSFIGIRAEILFKKK